MTGGRSQYPPAPAVATLTPTGSPFRRGPRWHGVAIALAIIGGAAILLLAGSHTPLYQSTGRPSHVVSSPLPLNPFNGPLLPVPAANQNGLTLHIATSPGTICALGVNTCPIGSGTSRVTMAAVAGGTPTPAWPDVQVAFVVETTSYDGVYWHYFGYPGTDKCALANGGQGLPCEESNGVPVFMDHAGEIANEIQAANPHSHVSFALVDFFGTDCGDWNDCGDSQKYHVDIPAFIPAAEFGGAVTSTLKDQVFGGTYYGIMGQDDNFLHSPSITALYGAIIGSGLDWSRDTHHVVVYIGSTAPRDPAYVENYAVSSFDACCGGSQPTGWVCEPSYQFDNGASPNCEGWVHPQDGNPKDSIAALARTSPTCTDSIGKVCTVDMIDLWDTATDPYSAGWPTGHTGGGPGGSIVLQNTNHVLLAGCDLTAATGGSWAGPSYFACPDGRPGTLQYVPHGPYNTPNTNNPTLMNAFRTISFGPIFQSLVANGTNQSMFSFVSYGNVKVAPAPQWTAACSHPNGSFEAACQEVPTIRNTGSTLTYGWNWSTVPTRNAMYVGDQWTVAFDVVIAGPPYQTVPVDACTTVPCKAIGSAPVGGYYTWANYKLPSNTSSVVVSFPLSTLGVQLTPPPFGTPVTPPPPPPVPPGIPVTAPTALPILSPVGTLNSVGVANISLQATAAGFLGAGFTRVGLKNRPIAMKMAAMAGKNPVNSRFDSAAKASGPGVGRFE